MLCGGVLAACGIGLVDRLTGRKSSGRTSTKLEGNKPTIRLSLRSLPVHHDPSPALRHSIRSPSMKPRSRFDWLYLGRVSITVVTRLVFPYSCYSRVSPGTPRRIYFSCNVLQKGRAASTNLSSVRVYGPAPARKPRRYGRGGWDHLFSRGSASRKTRARWERSRCVVLVVKRSIGQHLKAQTS